MGHAVLPVYDIRSALHGAGGIREHIGLRARDHGLEPRKGLRHLRHRHVPALTYDRAGLYGFKPFAEGSSFLDFWDFIVSTNLLPLGSITFAIFCCSKRYGWGWDNFVQEANSGSGLKVKNWMRPICQYVVPIAVAVIYIYGLATFAWK